MTPPIPRLFLRLCLAFFCLPNPGLAQVEVPPKVPYGDNEEVGKRALINEISIYYEIYGEGKPLLVIHPNSGNLGAMHHQIEHFSKSHRVIAVDSRGHGKSELGKGKLTYRQMADDYAKLLKHLEIESAHVLGWSDGGIIGLLLGIHHPDCVDKIAAMGANLNPGGDAVYEWAPNFVREMLEGVQARIDEGDTTEDWHRIAQVMRLLLEQPNIKPEELKTIQSPVLVMAGDQDVIREEHTVLIFQNLPKAHLCFFPGSTHFVAVQQPELFNRTVEKFLNKPFTRPDSKPPGLDLE